MTIFPWSGGQDIDVASIKEVQLYPTDDAFAHETTGGDCVCQPTCQPMERADGTFAYAYIHHALVGGES